MNSTFTPDEIAQASRLAKVAMALEQAQDPAALVQSLQGPGSYATWLNPPKTVKPEPYKGPGFWRSVGRSAIGGLDQNMFGIPGFGFAGIRGAVGLAPGPSGIGEAIKPFAKGMWGYMTGDRSGARQNLSLARDYMGAATARAQHQSLPYANAVSSWATDQHPTATRRLLTPWHTFKTWWNEPNAAPQWPSSEPRQDPWKPAYLPPIKTTPAP